MRTTVFCGMAWTALTASSISGTALAQGEPSPSPTASAMGASETTFAQGGYGDAEMSLFIGLGWHPPWKGSGAVRIDAEVVAQTSWSWLTVGPAVSLTLDPSEGPVVIDFGAAFTAYSLKGSRWHWGIEFAPAVGYVWLRDNDPDRAGASFRLTPFLEVNVQSEPTYDTYLAAEDELETLEAERTTCELLQRLPNEGGPAIVRLRQKLRAHCGPEFPHSEALKYLEQSFPTRGVRLRFYPGVILRTVKDHVGILSFNLAVLFP